MVIDPMTAIMIAGLAKDLVIELCANKSEDPEAYKAECKTLQKDADELERWLKKPPTT